MAASYEKQTYDVVGVVDKEEMKVETDRDAEEVQRILELIEEEAKLPTTGLGWIKYLHQLLAHATLPSHIQRIGTALMELLTTGSFHGADIFKRLHGEIKAPVSAAGVAPFKNARISFKIGTQSTKASAALYIRVLASLVKRGFVLHKTLPRHCVELASIINDPNRLHLMNGITQRWKATDQYTMSLADRHAFLIILAFVSMSDPLGLLPEPRFDILDLRSKMTRQLADSETQNKVHDDNHHSSLTILQKFIKYAI